MLDDKTQNQDEDISLRDLIAKIEEWVHYFWTKRWIILIAGIFGGIIGVTYIIYKKPVFTATTTFVLEEDGGGGGLGQYAGMAAMVGIDIGGGGGGLFKGDNILELYKSRSMIQKVLLTEGHSRSGQKLLIDQYLEINELRQKWKKPELKNISFADTSVFTILQDSILGVVVKDINKNFLSVMKPDKKLSILRVNVISTDQEFAKEFNAKIVDAVNKFYIDTKTKKSLQNINILQRQTDSVRNVLSGTIYSAAAAADATPNLNPVRQVLRSSVQGSQVNTQVNSAMLAEMLKQLEISKVMYRKETPLIQVIDQPIYPLSNNKMGKSKGLVIGGILMGFLAVLTLMLRRLYSIYR